MMKQSQQTIYLPGLNGLRAIAATAVVISHISLALGDFGLSNKFLGTDAEGHVKGLSLAGNGVTIFFTLSGFLITYLLLKEKEIRKLNVRDFYVRRLLRIWPLYYLYFALCIFTIACFKIAANSSSVPFYILLAANIPFITGKTLPFLAHYWSLGVEEQFYLFFPQLAKLSTSRLLRVSFILIVGLVALKAVFWFIRNRYGFEMPLQVITVTRFHIMLIGVCGAILFYNQQKQFMFVATHRLTQFASWASLLLITFNKFHIASVADAELVGLMSLFLIIGQVTKKNNFISLENKFFDFIGKISYGIYVIHPLIIFYFAKLTGQLNPDRLLNYALVYLIVVFGTVILAWVSYEFFEKHFLKLKGRFTVVKSSGAKAREMSSASVVV